MKFLIAANWKMNKTIADAQKTLQQLSGLSVPIDREVAIFAPFTALAACGKFLPKGWKLGGQNFYPADSGAFTGEISLSMLQEAGCGIVLTGHSERRALFHESDTFIGQKTYFALAAGVQTILCVGETLEERESGQLAEVLNRQFTCGLPQKSDSKHLTIAYEPVWAIGTGKIASEEEIAKSHAFIRQLLEARFGAAGKNIRILYGGSVKPENTKSLLALDNVNGVLVGGASLQAENFSQIITA